MGLGFYQTVSVDEAAERRAIREDAEDAAGMHEADATPERARGAPERVEESGVAAAAERGDGNGVERRRAVAVLLRDLLAAREVAEGADDGGATLRDDVGRPALRALARGEVLEGLVDLRPLRVRAVVDVGAEQPVQQEIPVVLGGRLALQAQHLAQADPRAH